MMRNRSDPDGAREAPEGNRRRSSLRPLHGPGAARHVRRSVDARRGPESSAETTPSPAGRTTPGVGPFPAWLRRLAYYGLALLLVATGVVVRAGLTRLVGPGLSTYLTFYPLVMLAAWIGGWGPGVLATVAAVVVADYWLLPPRGFKIGSEVDLVGLVFFCAVGILMSIVAERYRRLRDRLGELVLLRTAALRQANARLAAQATELEAHTEELRAHTEELANANAALRASEERFHQLFQEDLTGDFLCTPAGRILLCNPAFAAIFGFSSADAAVGTSMPELYLDPGEQDSILAALRAQGKLAYYETWRKRRDGTPIHVVENLVGHFNDQGEVYEIQGYIFDDTDRKQAEEALRELNATLESRVAERTEELEHRARQLQRLTLELTEAEERERERVAQILHDDLQQILAAAKFHLSHLKRGTRAPGQAQETIGQVQEMLADAIAKSRSLSHELSPAVLRRGDLVETFDWLAEQMQSRYGLTVRVEAVGAVQAHSDAVKTLLYRSAQEMLFNVVKHARVSEARLRVRRRGPYLCLSVSDRGRGFDPQEIGKTAGFGLWSIRERVALLGGWMKTRSVKGRGTTLRLVIPDAELSPTARQ
jgi:PAS domain S-box-containing protein